MWIGKMAFIVVTIRRNQHLVLLQLPMHPASLHMGKRLLMQIAVIILFQSKGQSVIPRPSCTLWKRGELRIA